MKAKAKVLAVKNNMAKIEVISDSFKFKLGEVIEIRRGSQRTLSQNAFYWAFLNWLINDAGMRDEGWFSPQALHDNMKEYFLATKIYDKGSFKAIDIYSSTSLNKSEFGVYMENVNNFVQEFFKINTAPFFETHEKYYRLGG